MLHQKICLASENWASAHLAIIKAVMDANESYALSYGSDTWTAEAQKTIQNIFNSNCKVFIIPTGTGANIFGLLMNIL
jgi:threonine aldolase